MNTHYLSRLVCTLLLYLVCGCHRQPKLQPTPQPPTPFTHPRCYIFGRGERISRRILTFKLGSDDPSLALKKAEEIGLHFTRFVPEETGRDPKKRLHSYQAKTENLRYFDVPIAMVYLHFFDGKLMNIVLFPREQEDIVDLRTQIRIRNPRPVEGRATIMDIQDVCTTIHTYWGRGTQDPAFVSYIDKKLADQDAKYRGQVLLEEERNPSLAPPREYPESTLGG